LLGKFKGDANKSDDARAFRDKYFSSYDLVKDKNNN